MLLVYYIFRADDLILDNQLVCYSQGRLISPVLNIPQLSIVLCVGFPQITLKCPLLWSLFGSHLGSHVGKLYGCSF